MEDGNRYCHSSSVLRVSDLIRFTHPVIEFFQFIQRVSGCFTGVDFIPFTQGISNLIRFTQGYLINHQLLESPVLLLVQYLRHPPFGQLERLRNLNDSLALYEVYHSHE